MPTTRIKDKLSAIVASQLPEHIRSSYPVFVSFVEAYYEYLEQDQYAQELIQNARKYSDIDETIESFIKYFQKQYINDIPRTALADKTVLVKKIRDLYNSKGSTKSYELFFKLIYNTIPELEYPGDYILRASSGDWTQRSTVFIRKLYGDEQEILNKSVFVTNSTKQTVLRLGSAIFNVKILSNNVEINSPDTFEYEFDNTTNVNLEIGDVVSTANSSYKGVVVGTPSQVRIISGGKNFTPGGVYNVVYPGSSGTKIKINSVDSQGGIDSVQLLTFGINYPEQFYYYLAPPSSVPGIQSYTIITSGVSSFTANVFEEHGRVTDSGNIVSSTGNVLAVFSFGSDVSTAPSETTASLIFRNGSKALYPGYYKTTSGFLSDNYVLQDRDYYQPYSYVIKSIVQLKEYKTALLNLLHPAGTKLHSTYVLFNNFSSATALTTGFGLALNDFVDGLRLSDTFSFTGSYTVVLPNISVSLSDVTILNTTKNLESGNSIIDSFLLSYDQTYSSGNSLTDTAVIDFTKALESGNTISDFANIDITLQIIGSVPVQTYTSEQYFSEIYTTLNTTVSDTSGDGVVIDDNLSIIGP